MFIWSLSPPTTTTHICFSVISIAHSSLMFSPHKYTSPITPLFARYPATSMLFRAISRSTRRCNFRPRRLFGALELGHGASEAEVLLKKSLASNGDLAIENCNLTLENWDLAIENWDLGWFNYWKTDENSDLSWFNPPRIEKTLDFWWIWAIQHVDLNGFASKNWDLI